MRVFHADLLLLTQNDVQKKISQYWGLFSSKNHLLLQFLPNFMSIANFVCFYYWGKASTAISRTRALYPVPYTGIDIVKTVLFYCTCIPFGLSLSYMVHALLLTFTLLFLSCSVQRNIPKSDRQEKYIQYCLSIWGIQIVCETAIALAFLLVWERYMFQGLRILKKIVPFFFALFFIYSLYLETLGWQFNRAERKIVTAKCKFIPLPEFPSLNVAFQSTDNDL